MDHAFRPFLRPRRAIPQILGLCCLIGCGAFPPASWGVELYRCSLDGQVEFRQTPCAEGSQTVTRVIEQSRGMTPAKPAVRLQEKPRKPHKPAKSAESAQRKAMDEKDCWKMEKKLGKIEQRLRAGYRASQYQELHRKQDEYEEYLRQFCRG